MTSGISGSDFLELMKLFLLIFSLMAAVASAQIPYGIRHQQLNAAGTSTVSFTFPYPASGSRGLIIFNPDSATPSANVTVLGTEFAWNAGMTNTLNLSPDFYSWLGDTYQPKSALLGEFAAMAPLGPDVALRTDGGSNLVAESPSGFLAWLDGVSTSAYTAGLAAKADVVHTHLVTDLSDSTSLGRSLVTAANAAAARSSIGAGTSNFSGSYLDLTSVPTSFTPSAHTHPWSEITSTPVTLSGYGITDPVVLTSGSYANPAWLTGLAWSKISGAPAFLTTEVDGSTTNEIELPAQTGQSGKVLSTNGASPSWVDGGTVTSVGLSSSTLSISGSPVTGSGSITANLPNVGTAGSYSTVTTDAQGRVSSGTTMAFATPTRGLNGTAFQVDASRAAFVSYTVDVACTLSLTGGQTGTVTLQYADDSAFTTNVTTVQSSVSGNTGTLTVGLSLTQTTTASLTGLIPAGKYVKILTANTAGTPVFTYRSAQEVKF